MDVYLTIKLLLLIIFFPTTCYGGVNVRWDDTLYEESKAKKCIPLLI